MTTRIIVSHDAKSKNVKEVRVVKDSVVKNVNRAVIIIAGKACQVWPRVL